MRRVNRNVCGTKRPRGLFASAVLFAVAAGCTSGDGGGNLSPSGGQNPDPVVLDFPIAYVKRPVPAADLPASDARELLDFQPGADLFVRDRASPSASDRNVTAGVTLGEGRCSRASMAVLQRHPAGLRDARGRWDVRGVLRRRGPADLEHLGVRLTATQRRCAA